MNAERNEGMPWPGDVQAEPTTPHTLALMENYGNASNVARTVVDQVLSRDAHGQRKYGVTLDRGDLTHSQWLQHLAEELMDGAHYALAAKREHDQFEQEVREIVDRARLSNIVLDSSPVQRAPLKMFNAGMAALVDAIRAELSK